MVDLPNFKRRRKFQKKLYNTFNYHVIFLCPTYYYAIYQIHKIYEMHDIHLITMIRVRRKKLIKFVWDFWDHRMIFMFIFAYMHNISCILWRIRKVLQHLIWNSFFVYVICLCYMSVMLYIYIFYIYEISSC